MNENMFTCPICGKLTKDKVNIYNELLRKQSFITSPILPTCMKCGVEVAVTNKCNGGNIIILNGTCGSGKSTVAEIFAKNGFFVIDGDCVIQTIKHKKNTRQVDFTAMADEIADEIDTLSIFGDQIVLASVIMPDDLNKYMAIFEARNMKYQHFLFKPAYQIAVQRCQSRTCHTSVTPEYWIKHFYDALTFDDRVMVVDNTNMTAEETAEYVLQFSL